MEPAFRTPEGRRRLRNRGVVRELVNPTDCESAVDEIETRTTHLQRICPRCGRLITYAKLAYARNARMRNRPCRKCHPKKVTPANIASSQFEYAGFKLTRVLLESGRELKCENCGVGDTWQNQPMTLQVDHVNGVRTENSLSNLRFLCPNCHSQTPTYGFRGRKHKSRSK